MFVVLVVAVIGRILIEWIRRGRSKSEIERLLSMPEFVEALKDDNKNIASIVDYLKERDQESKSTRRIFAMSSVIDKIMADIVWDVAGLIGMMVTVVLMIMVVSGAFEQIPKDIITGWLIILGYYFGKGGRRPDG